MPASNRKNFIISGIFALTALIAAVVFIYFILIGFSKNSDELIGLRKELAAFQDKSESLENAKKAYLSWQSSLEKIDKMFIDADAPIDFIKFLEKTSSDCSLKSDISSTASSQKSDSNVWNSLSFQLVLTGSFNNVLKFLDKIETGPYLISEGNLNIRELAMGEAGSGSSSGDVSAVLEIKVYTK